MSNYDDMWGFDRKDIEWPLGFLYMTPPEIEQGEYSNKIIITAPMIWDAVKQWEDTKIGRRGNEYEEWKRMCAEKLLDKMEEIHPGFRECIEAVNTASPLTIRDYYGVKEGAMCGYRKDCNNMTMSRVPVVTKAKNLLLTGQNCGGHGFCGVPLTAITTSEAILGQNYVLNKINGITE
jgi:all-trans-retinol 13,14-reductase